MNNHSASFMSEAVTKGDDYSRACSIWSWNTV